MGITAFVYRHPIWPDASTNNGWSTRFNEVTVVNAEGPFEPREDRPAVKLVAHRTVHAIHAVSVEDEDSGRWTMAGGAFLYSSDARFGKLCMDLLKGTGIIAPRSYFGIGAVSIHDRIED